MSLVIQQAGQITVPIDTPVTVESVHVHSVIFNFDDTVATGTISFLSGTGEVISEEVWRLSGSYYVGKIITPPSGSTVAEALLGMVSAVILEIYLDPALKQSLLESSPQQLEIIT